MNALLTKKNFLILAFILFSICQNSLLKAMDSIDFFNVGQGHAVLVNKAGAKAPLLIDAGSKSHSSETDARYAWVSPDKKALSFQITKRVLEIWQASSGGNLSKKELSLNIIVTHPDEDHKNLLPYILQALEEKASTARAFFVPNFLFGGKFDQYEGFLKEFKQWKKYKTLITYSEEWPEMCKGDDVGFLDASNCITHLFCPRGPKGSTAEDRNKWSIITRIQVNGMSALLTGDADSSVKKQMLKALGDRKRELETDILLAPHHGAEGTYHAEWDQLVNPRNIIVGSALMYKHPKGNTLLEFLNLKQGQGRIWNDRVMTHGLQYYCEDQVQQQIISSFSQRKDRLFDLVPNAPAEAQQLGEQWHLTWVDLPIYTLWTTGTLRFEQNLLEPKFVDTSHGLMGYIAVSDPQYLLNPYIRGKLTPLIPCENENHQEISVLVKEKYPNKEEVPQYINMILKESLLLQEHQDRTHYHNALIRIFSTIKPILYPTTGCFGELRKAIIERNKKVIDSENRVLQAGNFLFRDYEALKHSPDSDLAAELCNGAFETNLLVFKTFLRSTHNISQLKRYVKLSANITSCGPCESEIDEICPFGFPEWLQLAKLMEFFRNEVVNPTGESFSIGDMIDIVKLRNKGKNFKEIAKFIIFISECHELIKEHKHNEFYQKLEKYFPSAADDFLS